MPLFNSGAPATNNTIQHQCSCLHLAISFMHCAVTVLSLCHHCAVTVLSLHCHCTVTVLSAVLHSAIMLSPHTPNAIYHSPATTGLPSKNNSTFPSARMATFASRARAAPCQQTNIIILVRQQTTTMLPHRFVARDVNLEDLARD